MTEYSNCPNPECGAAWGIEEISFQECDSCGYPDFYDDDEDDIGWDDLDDSDDDYDEDIEVLFNHLM